MFGYIQFKYFRYHVVWLLLLIATTKESVEAQLLDIPAIDFIRHSVVQPIVHHGRSKRAITSTRDTAGDHHKQVTVTVNVDGEENVLDLSLNEHLVSRDYIISYQENGETVLRRPTKEELDICQYSGTVRGKPGSWVAVSTCRGISGVIHDGDTMKYIEPIGEEAVNGQHFLFDHADLKTTHRDDKNKAPENNVMSPRLLKRRPSEQIPERGGSRFKRDANSFNFDRRYVELVLVADNRLFRFNRNSFPNMVYLFKRVTNILNAIYAPLNISITLVGVVVWNVRDEIYIDEDSSITLQNFAEYRETTLLPKRTNDHAHLLTHQIFNEDTVGEAYLGGICTDDEAAGVTSTFSQVIGLVASTIAHELGHNLGMIHNKWHCACPDVYCIMSDRTTNGGFMQTQWSYCNKKSLASTYARNRDYCLRNVPGSVCGNGLVEAGEQCDCGPHPGLDCAACCHPRHCTRITRITSLTVPSALIRRYSETIVSDITHFKEVNEMLLKKFEILHKHVQ